MACELLYNYDDTAKVIVLASSGVWRMEPEDFNQFDEDNQVSCGEEQKYFAIYRVYYMGISFSWKQAQDYFYRRVPK